MSKRETQRCRGVAQGGFDPDEALTAALRRCSTAKASEGRLAGPTPRTRWATISDAQRVREQGATVSPGARPVRTRETGLHPSGARGPDGETGRRGHIRWFARYPNRARPTRRSFCCLQGDEVASRAPNSPSRDRAQMVSPAGWTMRRQRRWLAPRKGANGGRLTHGGRSGRTREVPLRDHPRHGSTGREWRIPTGARAPDRDEPVDLAERII